MKKLIFALGLIFAFVSLQGQGAMFLRGSQPAPTPGAGLLDSYKGSAFAMAPDVLLYSTYSALDDIAGSQTFGQTGQWSVAILRDSDNAIKSFTPGQVADGTANTWVQAAGAANGLVRRAYDQSVTALDVSNLNHANQTNTANMPKLFDSVTGLILENGKAAMEFDGGINLEIETEIDVVEQSIFSVTALPNITSSTQPFQLLSALSKDFLASGVVSFGSATSYLTNERLSWIFVDNPFTGVFGVGQTTADIPAGVYLHDFIFSNPGTSIYQNGSPLSLTATTSGDFNTSKYVSNYKYVGSRGTGQYSIEKLQFLAIFASDQSTNRPGIETAINTEYSIY